MSNIRHNRPAKFKSQMNFALVAVKYADLLPTITPIMNTWRKYGKEICLKMFEFVPWYEVMEDRNDVDS